MRLHHHPNVLSLHTSFLEGQHLWFVMPYIRGGSVFNIMKYRYKDVSLGALLSAMALWVLSHVACIWGCLLEWNVLGNRECGLRMLSARC